MTGDNNLKEMINEDESLIDLMSDISIKLQRKAIITAPGMTGICDMQRICDFFDHEFPELEVVFVQGVAPHCHVIGGE